MRLNLWPVCRTLAIPATHLHGMNFSEIFDGLSFPRNQDIELEKLLSAPLATLWANFPKLTPWTKDENGPLLPLYPCSTRLEQVQIVGLNPSYTASDRNRATYPVAFDGHAYFRRIGNFGRQVSDKYQQLFTRLISSSITLVSWTGGTWICCICALPVSER